LRLGTALLADGGLRAHDRLRAGSETLRNSMFI